jgi:hypothetical protein
MIDSSESGRPDALNIGPFCYQVGLLGSYVYLLSSVHNSPRTRVVPQVMPVYMPGPVYLPESSCS